MISSRRNSLTCFGANGSVSDITGLDSPRYIVGWLPTALHYINFAHTTFIRSRE